VSITSRINSESLISPSTSGPHFTAHRCPVDRLSRTIGSNPDRAKTLAVWLPIYPAPPVTSTRIIKFPSPKRKSPPRTQLGRRSEYRWTSVRVTGQSSVTSCSQAINPEEFRLLANRPNQNGEYCLI